jgi:hypothetical protein
MRAEESTMKRKLFPVEVGMAPLPKPPAPEISPGAFMLWPFGPPFGMTVEQFLIQQWLYLRAFEQAQAVVRPSLPERDLLAVWN